MFELKQACGITFN